MILYSNQLPFKSTYEIFPTNTTILYHNCSNEFNESGSQEFWPHIFEHDFTDKFRFQALQVPRFQREILYDAVYPPYGTFPPGMGCFLINQ